MSRWTPCKRADFIRILKINAIKRYIVVIEETSTGYSAYAPDLEGCVSTGQTREEVEKNMREAIALHLDGLRLEGIDVPATPHLFRVCQDSRLIA